MSGRFYFYHNSTFKLKREVYSEKVKTKSKVNTNFSKLQQALNSKKICLNLDKFKKSDERPKVDGCKALSFYIFNSIFTIQKERTSAI